MLQRSRTASQCRLASAAAPEAALQPAEPARRKGPCCENQWFRPRLVRSWYLGCTIRQIATREHLKPGQVEQVLREETVPAEAPPPASGLRRVA
jgi:hypothetical protein